MNLILAYHRSVHVLVMLGVLAYSVAEERMILALVAAPVIAAAYMLAGGPKGRPAPPWLVNLALLAATGAMVLNWSEALGDTVSVLCMYIVWLQLIKLFEPRTPRDRLQVLALSIMLVVGACLTAVTPELGAVLILYIPLLLATVLLHQIYAAAHHVDTPASTPAAGGGPWWWKASAWIVGAASPPPAAASPLPQPDARAAIDLGVVAACAGVATAVITIIIYLTLPRNFGAEMLGVWRPPREAAVTGFHDHVQLGAQGVISESQRVVMLVRIESPDNPAAIGRSHRLRGAVLDEYDPERGVWRQSQRLAWFERRATARAGQQPPVDLAEGPLLTLRISVIDRPMSHLFTKWMPVWIGVDGSTRRLGYRFNPVSRVASLPLRQGSFSYKILCAPQALSPPPSRRTNREPPPPPEPGFQSGPVHDLAVSLIRRARIDLSSDDHDARARAASEFDRYLRSTCTYTTQMIAPQPGRDPIETFLFDETRGRHGHCEYFASAVAAMCQAVGIPARVVTGYVASEFDPATSTYTVRENHAHAWAEVEVRPGRWHEVDPSPTEAIRRLHHPAGPIQAVVRRVLDLLQLAWVAGIVAFDQDAQADTLRRFTMTPMSGLRTLNEWIGRLVASERTIAEENHALLLARLAAWGVLAASAAFVGLHAAGRLALRIRERWLLRTPVADRAPDPRANELTGLFHRMLTVFARAGRPKPRNVPALAHAVAAVRAQPGLWEPAAALASLYYRVKFGGWSPTAADLAEANSLLRRLEKQVREHAADPPRGRSAPVA